MALATYAAPELRSQAYPSPLLAKMWLSICNCCEELTVPDLILGRFRIDSVSEKW